jgi:DNA-binding PadR family transcriptional regulator
MAVPAEFELRIMLTVLRCRDEAYALVVHEDLQLRTRRRASLGAVYVTLDRLERKGLLQSTLGEPRAERGGRARRYYRLSRKGLATLRHACLEMQHLWEGLEIAEERR